MRWRQLQLRAEDAVSPSTGHLLALLGGEAILAERQETARRLAPHDRVIFVRQGQGVCQSRPAQQVPAAQLPLVQVQLEARPAAQPVPANLNSLLQALPASDQRLVDDAEPLHFTLTLAFDLQAEQAGMQQLLHQARAVW